ncbi:ABC transporter ATP-binding protein [Microbacterium sp. 18062]|uniref:ABC transporter ATP-binding protein n=1 Tax=Microbacterium sp. 18062 TaxID=2681410 RepID=UPI0013591A29|nr:ABC transporter ATP-binding protein [Microbacterium sp. 18062]
MNVENSTQPLLEVDHLDVHYGGFHAVKDASLRVYEGERVAIVGESGSGKTTLGLALGGFIDTRLGTVTAERLAYRGMPLTQPHTRIPRSVPGISMVFQDAMTSLDPVSTVGSQITGVLRKTHALSRRAASAEAIRRLDALGVRDAEFVMASRPGELSGGMRQRVMVAIATAGDPALLIADEPTSALDVNIGLATMRTLTGMADEGRAALLFITHDIELCARFADYVVVMYRGEIVENLPARDLSRAQHPYTLGLLSSVPRLDSADLDELPVFDSGATTEEPVIAAIGG